MVILRNWAITRRQDNPYCPPECCSYTSRGWSKPIWTVERFARCPGPTISWWVRRRRAGSRFCSPTVTAYRTSSTCFSPEHLGMCVNCPVLMPL